MITVRRPKKYGRHSVIEQGGQALTDLLPPPAGASRRPAGARADTGPATTGPATAVVRATAARERRAGARVLRWLRLGPDWPFVVLLAGFPLWWLLGLSEILVFVLMIPMVLRLLGRRGVVVPPGFGWWMIFLGWVVVGLPLLFADAPSGVPGGGAGRLPVFFYRLLWYLACTVVLLWIGNLDERDLPSRRVVRLIGWLFVITTAGGLLGVLAPRFELTSLVELFLPKSLATNDFVVALAHPKAADIQNVLGPDQARPIAPFAYANSWGSNFALTLPFFLAGWLGGRGWRRAVAPAVLLLSAVPVIYSLNRGLWICLALGAAVLAVRLAFSGRVAGLVALGLVIVVGVGVVAISPLGSMLVERLNNPHSNGRREQLLVETVRSTLSGSPVAGFGSTRRVQGNFESIAGGSTPGCHDCGVPPLGTQGHLWLVIFSQGVGGLVAFGVFFGLQLARYWRSRTTLQAVGTTVLLFFAVQLFIYDTLGWPLFIVMGGIGLMWRERWRSTAAIAPANGSLRSVEAEPATARSGSER